MTDKLPPTDDPRCGTNAGYFAHRTRGELSCSPCQAAHRVAGRGPARALYHRKVAAEPTATRGLYLERTRARQIMLRARTEREADSDFARLRGASKPCAGCGELLPAEAFQRTWTTPDGRATRCNRNGCRKRHWRLKRDVKLRAHWEAKGIDPAVCLYCQDTPAEDLEHVMPKALGGSDDFSNLAPACPTCNRGVGGKFDAHPLDWLAARFPERLGAIVALFPHIALEATHV